MDLSVNGKGGYTLRNCVFVEIFLGRWSFSGYLWSLDAVYLESCFVKTSRAGLSGNGEAYRIAHFKLRKLGTG